MAFSPAYWRAARFLFFALACLTALGGLAFFTAPQSIFPSIELARVETFVEAGDLDAEQIESAVAHPLERRLAMLPGVLALRTYADTGKLEVELDFDPHGDVRADEASVQAAMGDARQGLPIERTTTLIEGPNLEPVVTFAVRSASASQAALRDELERALVPALTGTPGLERVAIFGGPRLAYHIDLDGRKLRAAGVTARDVAEAVRAASEPHAAGTLVRGAERFDVVAGDPPHDVTTLANVRVPGRSGRGVLALRDLGRITFGDEPTGQQATFDGERAVLINAYPTARGDAVALRDAVASRLPRLRRDLPADARIDPAWDQTRPIRAAQDSLRAEMLAGAAIALAVIFFFLRDRTMIAIAAIVVPATLALTTLILVRLGLSLNVMTLGGLAIAIGLAIDEAIVVLEAIARELGAHPELPRRVAIAQAVRRIARPLLAATAANVVVFLPLGLLSGVPGFFFRALSITLAIALIVSIGLSLVIAPLLADALRARTRTPPALGLEGAYVRVLERALGRRAFVYAGAAAILALTAVLLVRLPTDFLPAVDEGQFEIKYSLPPGMSLAAADAVLRTVERTVASDRDVAHATRLSGVDTNGYLATPPDAGTIRVLVRPHASGFDALAERLRASVLKVAPDVYLEIHQLLEDQINDLSGAPEPIQLTIRGPDQATLVSLADRFAEHVDDVPGLVDTFDGVIYQARSIDALPPQADANPRDFADSLRARIGGLRAGDIAAPSGSAPAIVRVTGDGPLAAHARLAPPRLTSEIQEENGERLVRVTAGLENANLSKAIARLRRTTAYDLNHLPAGYSVEFGGAVAAQGSAFGEFGAIIAVAVLLVFGILVLAFDSFRLPLVVLAAVPLAPLGVALALQLTNTSIDVASIMGFLLLVGIVVRNGILLVDGANRRRREGDTPEAALARAAIERLRPIVMTTVATLGALAPLALGFAAGSELERPLAVAVIGGLITATAFTLILIPVLYASVEPGTSSGTEA